jgi:hypothetical protein
MREPFDPPFCRGCARSLALYVWSKGGHRWSCKLSGCANSRHPVSVEEEAILRLDPEAAIEMLKDRHRRKGRKGQPPIW